MNKTTMIQVSGVLVELLTEGDAIARMTNNQKDWEPGTRSVWGGLTRPGDMVIDVGAYTGVYSIASAMMGAKVIALEPHPANYKRLRANAALNSVRIEMIEAAASKHAGFERLYMKRGLEVLCDTASLVDEMAADVVVKAIRIDDLKLSAHVGTIKIDVEHGEVGVLLGAIRTIASHRPTIMVELLDDRVHAAVNGLMAGLGYKSDLLVDKRNHFYRYRG